MRWDRSPASQRRCPRYWAKDYVKARQQSSPKRIYASLDEAAEDRTQGFGGLTRIRSYLVARNMEPFEGGWRWRSDARLRWPSLSLHD